MASWQLTERAPVVFDSERVVHSASTIKVAILIAAFHAVDNGGLGLGDQVALPAHRPGGTGVLRELRCRWLRLDDLLTLMIVISDNTATNAVLSAVGFDEVAAVLDDLGCTATAVERYLMYPQNTGRLVTTALDQARMMAQLATGRAVSPESTEHALHMLSRQQVRDRVPARLPEEARCWNKTGEVSGTRHDVALLGRYQPECVLAVLSDRVSDERAACDYMADLGAAAYRALVG